MAFELFERESARERLASLLRKAIFTGKLKAGERIVESQLAREMGVGQPTIREGLHVLENEGLVTRTPMKGCRVTYLCVEDIAKIYDVRIELEVLAIGKIPESAWPQLCKRLEAAVDRMRKATERNDIESCARSDFEFHRMIWEASGNEFLVKSLISLTTPLWAFSQIYYYDNHSNLALEDVVLHEKILNIIRSRSSVSKKQAAARKILENFCDNALRYFPRQAEQQIKPQLTSVQSL
jgi:DNA-binding GntR family transcriptional regulator